jgi:uncharacterized protein (TIRG00374 family)
VDAELRVLQWRPDGPASEPARAPAPGASGSVAPPELDIPEELSKRNLRSRLLLGLGLAVVVVAVVALLPGLGELRERLSHARPSWLALGVILKVFSGLGYIVIFRMVFCRRMSWGVSAQVGMSELGANALFPTGGAGGLALGAWALRRGGMPRHEIARRTVAFFLLTSVPNVVGVFLIGLGLAAGALPGSHNLLLTLLPAAAAFLAVAGTLFAGRLAAHLKREEAAAGNESRQGRLQSTKRVLAKGAGVFAEGVDEALSQLRERNPLLILGMCAYLAFDVMILWAGFHAFGSAPPIAIVWMGYLIGELGGLVPVPGGIGGVDLGLVGMLVLYGVPLAPTAAAVLTYRAIALWVPAILGAIAFIALRRTLRKEAYQFSLCAPETEMQVIGVGRVMVGSSG